MSQGGKPAKRALASVAEARAAMVAAIKALPAEKVVLDDALNRVLAQDVIAVRDQPPLDVSAMDGYAVRSVDTPGILQLAGESAAGRSFAGRCGEGMAIRISTGAAVPDGADSVVIQEDVQRDGRNVTVPEIRPGQNIRPRGGDFKAGASLLVRGRLLDSVGLSLAAASGRATLLVTNKPRVSILSSGDELAVPGTVPRPAKYLILPRMRLPRRFVDGAQARKDLPWRGTTFSAIAHAAEQVLRVSDVLVLVGGASVGDHDHARPALLRLGLELVVESVAVRPGKPTWFGKTPWGVVLGLPGNPASALVCAELFLRPLLVAMLGLHEQSRFRRAILSKPLPANGPREHYLRSTLAVDEDGRLTVCAFEDQDSSLISVFASANALIRLPAGAAASPAGALVDVLPLDGPLC